MLVSACHVVMDASFRDNYETSITVVYLSYTLILEITKSILNNAICLFYTHIIQILTDCLVVETCSIKICF